MLPGQGGSGVDISSYVYALLLIVDDDDNDKRYGVGKEGDPTSAEEQHRVSIAWTTAC